MNVEPGAGCDQSGPFQQDRISRSARRLPPHAAAPAASLQRSAGEGRVAFKRRGSATVLDEVYQSGSCRIRFPGADPGSPYEAVVLNTAGGLTDDDIFTMHARWGADTHAAVTTQAAERVYRSRGLPARAENRLEVADGATAFWLPQETIMFDGGRLSRRLEADIGGTGRLIACESVVFGRHAMGEAVREGFLLDAWRVRLAGRLVFADTLRLDGGVDDVLSHPATASRARAAASVICAGEKAAALLEPARGVVTALQSVAGCSVVGSVLLVRILAADGARLRGDLSAVLTRLMSAVSPDRDAPEDRARLPRLWNC